MVLPILIIFLSVCLTLIVVPFAKAISYRISDLFINSRDIDSQVNIPLLGGLPLLFSLGTLIVIGIKLSEALILSESGLLLITFVAGLIIFLVGLFFDLKFLSFWLTFLGQIAVSIILVSSGVVINYENQIISILFSISIIIIITNAVNIQDNIDGLSIGLALIGSFFFGIIFYLQSNIMGMLIAGIIVGSNLVTLYYNIKPTQLMLGSNGAYLNGLLLGIMLVFVAISEFSLKTIVVPIIILAVPLLYSFWAFFQFLLKKQPLFRTPTSRMYLRMLSKKFSIYPVVIIFWALGFVFGIIGIWVYIIID